MEFKFGKELIKALYKIRDAIKGEENNNNDDENNDKQNQSGQIFGYILENSAPFTDSYFTFGDNENKIPNSFPNDEYESNTRPPFNFLYFESDIDKFNSLFKSFVNTISKYELVKNDIKNAVNTDGYIEVRIIDENFNGYDIRNGIIVEIGRCGEDEENGYMRMMIINTDSNKNEIVDIMYISDIILYNGQTDKFIWENDNYDIDNIIDGTKQVQYYYKNSLEF